MADINQNINLNFETNAENARNEIVKLTAANAELNSQLKIAKDNLKELSESEGALSNKTKEAASEVINLTNEIKANNDAIKVNNETLKIANNSLIQTTESQKKMSTTITGLRGNIMLLERGMTYFGLSLEQSRNIVHLAMIGKAAYAVVVNNTTVATEAETVAVEENTVAWYANPIGLVIAGLVALGVAIYGVTQYLSAENVALRENAELKAEAGKNSAKEIVQLELLKSKAEDANIPIQQRNEAVKELQKLYPDYFSNLTTEQIEAGKVGDVYKQLTIDIRNVAEAKAISDKITKLYSENLELQAQTEASFWSKKWASIKAGIANIGLAQMGQKLVSANDILNEDIKENQKEIDKLTKKYDALDTGKLNLQGKDKVEKIKKTPIDKTAEKEKKAREKEAADALADLIKFQETATKADLKYRENLKKQQDDTFNDYIKGEENKEAFNDKIIKINLKKIKDRGETENEILALQQDTKIALMKDGFKKEEAINDADKENKLEEEDLRWTSLTESQRKEQAEIEKHLTIIDNIYARHKENAVDIEQSKQDKIIFIIEETAKKLNEINDIFSDIDEAHKNKELAAAKGDEAKQEEIRKKYFEREKKSKVKGAIISGLASVASSFKAGADIGGPWVGAAYAAIAAAASIANVIKIKSVQYEGGEGDSSGATAAAATAAPVTSFVSSKDNQLADNISGAVNVNNQQPIKAYVVSTDISSAQELDRKAISNSTIG